MTAIAPAPPHVKPPASVDSSPRAENGPCGGSFAGALSSLLDRAPGEDVPLFQLGTVGGKAVERFDADGFLQGDVERPAGGAMSLPATARPTGYDGDPAPDDDADAPARCPAMPAGGGPTTAPVARDAEAIEPAAVTAPWRMSAATPSPFPSVATTAVHDHSLAIGAAAATTPLALRPSRPAAPGPVSSAAPRAVRTATPAAAASPILLGLDRDGTTVSVAVTAAIDPQDDAEGLREAVVRTLARHGLVLGELKINRRAGGNAFDER